MDNRTEEKQLMDFDRKLGFKMGLFSILRSDLVRIRQKLSKKR